MIECVFLYVFVCIDSHACFRASPMLAIHSGGRHYSGLVDNVSKIEIFLLCLPGTHLFLFSMFMFLFTSDHIVAPHNPPDLQFAYIFPLEGDAFLGINIVH